ncbi:MAG: hypothetical protein DMG76_13120 [Acidobacteria bacterium]|nr:MAG: hypothetical protein DMG76_13120 [Acidobacteriota bacterium]
MKEVITLCVFVVFARSYLGESVKWNHPVSRSRFCSALSHSHFGEKAVTVRRVGSAAVSKTDQRKPIIFSIIGHIRM